MREITCSTITDAIKEEPENVGIVSQNKASFFKRA